MKFLFERILGRVFVACVLVSLVACRRDNLPPASQHAPLPLSSRAPHTVLGPAEFLKDAAAFSTFSEDANRRLAETGSAVMDIDVERYDLQGRFDWDQKVFHGVVTMEVRIRSDGGSVLALDSAVRTLRSVAVGPVDPQNNAFDSWVTVPFEIDRVQQKLMISKWDLPSEAQRAGGRLRVRVTYEAASNGAAPEVASPQTASTLHAVAPRADDPLSARVVYTTAEPLGAATWMPCHYTPADRALFRIRLDLPIGERAIANGRLVSETVDTERQIRRVEYATDASLPTYLMAFAIGEFQVTEIVQKGLGTQGALPLSIWSRKGLRFDAGGLLESIVSMMEQMEAKLVPFPFEKYAVVMLPQFPAGGIEHASVTFQAETRTSESDNARDYGLTAHELGHQWFGDLVTVKTWDDLWIKEGLATLLAAEVTRPFEDRWGKGILFGHRFGFAEGEAMRDRSRAPGDKYTSGPYGRSAWFWTQVRSVVGEDVFWEVLRNLLRTHAFGSIGTSEVLDALRPHLSEEQNRAAAGAIDNPAVPRFVKTAKGTRLEDPGTSLIVPLEFHFLGAEGRQEIRHLSADGILLDALLEDPTSVAVFDPLGVHPDLVDFGPEAPKLLGKQGGEGELLGQNRRMDAQALTRVVSLGPVAAQRLLKAAPALDLGTERTTESSLESWHPIFASLGSDAAELLFVQRYCQGISEAALPAENPWREALAMAGQVFFRELHFRGTSPADGDLTGCLGADASARRAARREELQSAVQRLDLSSLDLSRIQQFLIGDSEALPLWRALAVGGVSLRVRGAAVAALAHELRGDVESRLLESNTERAQFWRDTLNDVLSVSAVSENLGGALGLAAAFAEVPVMRGPSHGAQLRPGFTHLFLKPLPNGTALSALCSARTILGKSAWATLSSDIAQGPNASALDRIASRPQVCSSSQR